MTGLCVFIFEFSISLCVKQLYLNIANDLIRAKHLCGQS